jgi:hypothetical protein
MKNILFKKLKFLIMLGVSIIFVLPKNTIAVDASHVAKVIYKIGSWQVVEIPGKSKIMYKCNHVYEQQIELLINVCCIVACKILFILTMKTVNKNIIFQVSN